MRAIFSVFFLSLFFVSILLIILSILILFFERKFIGIIQKRLGISFLGRNGWAHLPADIVKFWSKNSFKNSSIWGYSVTSVFITLIGYYLWNLLSCIFFINNGGSQNFDFLTYQILFYFGYANLTTLYLFYIIVSLKSKYALVGGIRLILVSIFLEFSFGLNFFVLYIYSGGFNFNDFVNDNSWYFLPFALPIISFFLFIYSLYEAKRAPFDHAEAESELVAGHIVEFCGKSLLFFFFSEYIHLYFCIYLIFIFFFGGNDEMSAIQIYYYSDTTFSFASPYCTNFLGLL